MHQVLRSIFFTLVARPIVWLVLGVNIRHRERLPAKGPAIIVANHNSHLDTVVLMSICPRCVFPALRPVAAADYFMGGGLLTWFAVNILRIVPLKRHRQSPREDPLDGASRALFQGEVLIVYPEGSRGEPERMERFKSGVSHLAKRHSSVPVIPVFMQGLGRVLPKGEWLIVPFFCDVVVGEPLFAGESRKHFAEELEASVKALADEFSAELSGREKSGGLP